VKPLTIADASPDNPIALALKKAAKDGKLPDVVVVGPEEARAAARVDLVDRIIEDLRAEADRWNERTMDPRVRMNDEQRRTAMKLYEELRRLANRYEDMAYPNPKRKT